jgi:hypothetical protein
MPNPNKFKSSNNNWKTRALFADIRLVTSNVNDVDPSTCPYFLFESEDDIRPCLKDLFLKLGDPTGTKMANEYLGGWEHFKALQKCSWFKEIWKDWQEELQQIKLCAALEKIEEIADSDSAQRLAANKYLAGKEWEAESKSPRGRPTKEEVSGELKRAVQEVKQIKEDRERMHGLSLVVNNS